MPTSPISKNIFRAYDIRGEVGKEWCIDDNYQNAYLIGQAIGSQLSRRQSKDIIVGRDGRTSSPNIAQKLIEGLLSTGCNVIDIGLTATPVLYFALTHLNIPNAVMVTGSHNPASHNGIKIVYEFAPLSPIMIETLFYDIRIGDFETSNDAKHRYQSDIIEEYQRAILNDVHLKKPLKIGIDCGNGATSLFAEKLFNNLGCEVNPLFCELDGTFPNHSPDPTVPKNLQPLMQLVKQKHLDLGIAFDGDGDRVIFIDSNGKIIWPDRMMILLAQDILKEHPASRIIFDVKCSYLLPKFIQKSGGQPAMCASGHSILKMHMTRLDAALGGEFSGHIILRDRWNNFDDGPYVAARLLEILSRADKNPTDVFASLPDSISTPEHKLMCESSEQAQQILDTFISHADFSGASLSLIDGIRVDYKDGWGLVRSSNTLPCLTFRFEAKNAQILEQIQLQFRQVFQQIELQLDLPF